MMHPDDQAPAFEFDANSGVDELPAESELHGKVMAALREIYDPEIPVNLVELGLIYNVDVADDGKVKVEMTLTTPSCPVAEGLPPEVERAVAAVDGVTEAQVELVWTPIWHPGLMSEEAKLQLGMM